jgi:hypothetical protein
MSRGFSSRCKDLGPGAGAGDAGAGAARGGREGDVLTQVRVGFGVAARAHRALRAPASVRCLGISFLAIAWPPMRAISATVIDLRRFFGEGVGLY